MAEVDIFRFEVFQKLLTTPPASTALHSDNGIDWHNCSNKLFEGVRWRSDGTGVVNELEGQSSQHNSQYIITVNVVANE